MFARVHGDLAIQIDEHDKRALDTRGRLEHVLAGSWPEKKIVLVVRDRVPRIRGHTSEPGWRVEIYPPESDYEARREWRVILDREQYAKLIEKGYNGTRWLGGLRCEINYFNSRQI